MKGFRFYQETKLPVKNGFGSVFALCLEHYPYSIEGFSGVQEFPNHPVNWNGACLEYLRDDCKRISEFKARRLHPEVFKRLDEDEIPLTLRQRKMMAWSSIIHHRFVNSDNKWIIQRLSELRIAVAGYNTLITSIENEPKGFDEREWSLSDFIPM